MTEIGNPRLLTCPLERWVTGYGSVRSEKFLLIALRQYPCSQRMRFMIENKDAGESDSLRAINSLGEPTPIDGIGSSITTPAADYQRIGLLSIGGENGNG